jgi:hypothetical protein
LLKGWEFGDLCCGRRGEVSRLFVIFVGWERRKKDLVSLKLAAADWRDSFQNGRGDSTSPFCYEIKQFGGQEGGEF